MFDHRLKSFLIVADHGSFSRAGEQMYISPTAVIKRINALEQELGVTLFQRTSQGIALTPAGRSIYADAKYIINYSEAAINRAKALENAADNVICVGESLNTPCGRLVDLWPQIIRECPELRLKVSCFENKQKSVDHMFKTLGTEIDVFLGLFDPVMLEQRGCSAVRLSQEPLRVAIPNRCRLSGIRELRVADLAGEHLMMVRPGKFQYYDELRHYLKQKNSSIVIENCESMTVDVLNDCENRGVLAVIIDPWCKMHPLFTAVPVAWDYSTPYGVVCAKNPSPKVLAFLAALKKSQHLAEEDCFFTGEVSFTENA